MTPQEFSTKIKVKYPVYKDMDDVELAQKIVAKHPVYASQVNFEKKGILRKIADVFTGGVQEYGKTTGQALAVGAGGVSDTLSQTSQQGSGIEADLIKRIRENKTAGKDTARLENALTMIREDVAGVDPTKTIQQVAPKSQISNTQALGESALAGFEMTGLPALTRGLVGGATKAVAGQLGKQTLGQVVKQTAKQSAVGAGIGYTQDVATGLAQGKGSESFMPSVGTAIGAAIPVVGGAIRGSRVASQAKQALAEQGSIAGSRKTAESIAREFTTQGSLDKALSQGRVGKTPLVGKTSIALSKTENEIADAVERSVIKNNITDNMVKNEPTKVLKALGDDTSSFNKGIKESLALPENKNPFNKATLNKALSVLDPETRILTSDKVAQKDYKKVVDIFKSFVKKNDNEGMFEARQAFDSYMRKTYPNVFEQMVDGNGNLKPQVQALRDVRELATNFVAKRLPPNHPLIPTLKEEHKLLTAFDNYKDKFARISTGKKEAIPMSKAKRFLSTPTGKAVKVGGAVAGLGALGTGGASVIGD